jgi:serine/threonine protein kinase
MAPEGGQATVKSDVYALGLTLASVLLRRRFCRKNDDGAKISQIRQTGTPIRRLLARVVGDMLNDNPKNRPGAQELVGELQLSRATVPQEGNFRQNNWTSPDMDQ